jgi:hypothetical protein
MAPVTRRGDDGAATIHGEIEEESVARRFSSIRVRKGIHRRWAERRRQLKAAAWPSAGGGRGPGWARVGPSARGNGPKSMNKENGLFKWF